MNIEEKYTIMSQNVRSLIVFTSRSYTSTERLL